jgi:Fic family protein
MKRELQGHYITVSVMGENVRAFTPTPLPPNPPINWSVELQEKFDNAHLALGRLDGVSRILPEISQFLYMYVRKEALLSSMIENTQSSLSDLLLFEMGQNYESPLDDVQEVSNYVAAILHGIERLREGMPLSLRLMREIHEILLRAGRGRTETPGEFRRTQNWIGGKSPGKAAFVPPPASKVLDCMGKLELFLHDSPSRTPVLVKAALAHVQFETIHPFLDGNGRLGRLLITLLLCEQKALGNPLLYLSLFFKSNRELYYKLLNDVRLTGDWESWLDFFAEAVLTTATQAVETAQTLLELMNKDRDKIIKLGRFSPTALKIHQKLIAQPVVSASWLQKTTGLTAATVNNSLAHLQQSGILKECSGRKRRRVYSYDAYLEIINEGI